MSAHDDYNIRSIWHQTANNVGCTDQPVHLEPCCGGNSSSQASSCDVGSGESICPDCQLIKGSRFSPDSCSRETLVEWLPRTHAAIFPHVLQFDSVDELFGILTELKENPDLNMRIRQNMRRETLRLALHNSGALMRLRCHVRLFEGRMTLCHQVLPSVSWILSKEFKIEVELQLCPALRLGSISWTRFILGQPAMILVGFCVIIHFSRPFP